MSDNEAAVETFESVEQGGSRTHPAQCSSLRKGGHVVIKGFPCKIVDMSTSKTGKHGHAKVHLVGVDIFTNKKYEDLSPSTHNMDVPEVSRFDYTIVDIQDDGFVSLMKQDGSTKDDLKLPPDDELANKIKEAFDEGKEVTVTVLSSMGIEQIMSFKA